MDPREEIKRLNTALKEAESVQAELDLRVFNLKTLYDVSKDIYGSVESDTIIRNFLLMTMGNFGVMQAFILLLGEPDNDTHHFLSIGFQDELNPQLEDGACRLLSEGIHDAPIKEVSSADHQAYLPAAVDLSLPF